MNSLKERRVCSGCLQIEMDTKYRGKVNGLCGNMDGQSNDFDKDGEMLCMNILSITVKECQNTETFENIDIIYIDDIVFLTVS